VNVRATAHAVERARSRFPAEFQSAAHQDICIALAREVEEAITAGRMARNEPRWAHRGRLDKRTDAGRTKPAARFVWTEDEHRVHLILRQSVTLILTVIPGRAAVPA
jgi:hypothetical protein